ncbi:hypothetical protein [Streptomyces albireticuli]|uniref:Uncharacterized protein n=1 Tax=Streptomyces albireticuli TaxID=1940 RepID=A0A2A2DBQ3_9ACTN|nr:hypothetical protein [Streptomyces albireticuli]MCD9145473.1 hypothetical protein [Streptomyces albireticuli]MCD9164962.1 hypothetical protein [Streptomyces albireticuli]MCD9195447.1 hypothetical protein [Streptomyces albireticuli]PAU48732.1 hypothetical protein CK936_11840 [Streptomyces albireticuli]
MTTSQQHFIARPYGRAAAVPRRSPRSPSLDWPKDLVPLLHGRLRGVNVAAQERAARAATP